jgi:putative oxidoreductase
MTQIERYASILGRILIAQIFIISGFGKITNFSGIAGYIGSQGIPFPYLAAICAILIEIGCSSLIIFGFKSRWAAAVLCIFTFITAFGFHNFWSVPAEQVQNQMIHFMKNISMMGGLLFVMLYDGTKK